MSDRPADYGCTSGASTREAHEILIEMVGRDVVERAIGKLDPATREAYESATSITWIPCEAVEAVYGAIAEEASLGLEDLQADVMRAGVDRTLRTLWRILLRFTSDKALVARTPMFYRKVFNTGALTSAMKGEGRAEIEMTGWPEITEFHLRGLMVGIQCVLERAGRRNVVMRPRRTRGGAIIDARWGW